MQLIRGSVELHEQIEKVRSKEDLADFISALIRDFETNPGEWENNTLPRFLTAMEDWVRTMDNYYKNTGRPPVQNPIWRIIADILLAATMYE